MRMSSPTTKRFFQRFTRNWAARSSTIDAAANETFPQEARDARNQGADRQARMFGEKGADKKCEEGGAYMKRRLLQKFLLLLVCLGVMTFVIPAQSPAMETLKWGDGQEFTFWGFLQNNTAMFTQNPNP